MAQQKEFICPICKSTEYEKEIEHNGIYGPGSSARVLYYTCRGCSVVFTDVAKFSKK